MQQHVENSTQAASRAAFGVVSPSSSDQPHGALGRVGNSVEKPGKEDRKKALRLASFAAKRTAAKLLRDDDPKHAKRISSCCYVPYGDVDLMLTKKPDGTASAHFSGLTTCQSVWCCPICSPRISAKRRDELNDVLSWARRKGHSVALLTLTARHSRKTALAPFVEAMKAATKRLRQSGRWRGLGLVGSVTAMEVTHGEAAGFHPHQHLVLILPASAGDPVEAVERVRGDWMHALAREGLSGNHAAFQVQPADAVGEYITKWGAAEEMTLSTQKQGRAGSRSPWQLLADARDGCARSAALWREFAAAFRGKRQLVYSRGLREMVAEDTEETEEPEETPEPVLVRRWLGAGECWKLARRRLVALLDAAEEGTSLDAAEFGPTDAARWRCELAASTVLDDQDPGLSPGLSS